MTFNPHIASFIHNISVDDVTRYSTVLFKCNENVLVCRAFKNEFKLKRPENQADHETILPWVNITFEKQKKRHPVALRVVFDLPELKESIEKLRSPCRSAHRHAVALKISTLITVL